MKSKLINSLVTLTNVEVVFTLDEWKAYKNDEITSLDIILEHKYNMEFYKYRKFITFGVTLAISFILMSLEAHAATVGDVNSIDLLGEKFVHMIQKAGYWICFAKGLVDIIKELLKGGDKADGIGRIMFKYVLAFASFYLLPFCFDLIRTSLS